MNNQPIKYEVLDLFPTPLFTTELPEQYGRITEWFYQQEMIGGDDDEKGVDEINYGQRSKNSYILDEPEAHEVKTYVLGLVKLYGDMLGYDYESYRFGQSWLSYKFPGQQHIQHTHPNSLISGVFYFGLPTEKTPAIKFHDMRGGMKTSYISPKKVPDKRELKYAWEFFNVNFSPGLLLLFPSYLHHSVPVNKSDSVRCSLAFNAVPTIGFGEEGSLTELKF